MGLPLLERAADDDVAFALTRRSGGGLPLISARTVDPSRIPDRAPGTGEQYCANHPQVLFPFFLGAGNLQVRPAS